MSLQAIAEHLGPLPAEDAAVRVFEAARAPLLEGDPARLAGELAKLRELEGQRRCWVLLGLAAGLAPLAIGARRGHPPTTEILLAEAFVTELEQTPADPLMLAVAALLLERIGSRPGAATVAEAAVHLAPELVGALVPAAADAGSPAGGEEPPVYQLEGRARALAARAVPAQGLSLSLCMIVRDEEQALGRCLASVGGLVDEIVIVDTGSRDGTVELARDLGAKVIELPWQDSFAAARNASLEAASGDWLMFLDADEALVAEDAALLRPLLTQVWREAFTVTLISHTGMEGAGTRVSHEALRILRNRDGYRFQGRVHEQIAPTLPLFLPGRLGASPMRVEHFGYLEAVRAVREKSARNVALLERERCDGPASPFLHFNLGSEHAAAGDSAAARRELARAWEMLRVLPGGGEREYAPVLLKRLAAAQRACGHPREALETAAAGLELFADFTDLILERAYAWIALGEAERGREACLRCLELGDAPVRYGATAGCGGWRARLALAELAAAAGQAEERLELLEGCVREAPAHAGCVEAYAEALLEAGQRPAAVVAVVERLLGAPSAPVRHALGLALQRAEALDSAEEQFRAALRVAPQASISRLALAEVLLAQRSHARAAHEAAGLPDGEPLSLGARRVELIALCAGGQPGERAVAALERGRAAGMGASECSLFEAWLALAERRTPGRLGFDTLPRLVVLLQQLLRRRDFEAFELALGLLELMPLTLRQRTEQLAELYLQEGFLASAAQEWMAVCEEQPDADALVGLARVASAGGMTVEARDFATAALEQEPGNEVAARLLAAP